MYGNLCVLQLMDTEVITSLGLLWVMLLWTLTYKSSHGRVFSFLHSRSGMAGSYNTCVLNFIQTIATLFSKVAAAFCIPTNSMQEFQVSVLGLGWNEQDASGQNLGRYALLGFPGVGPAWPWESVSPSMFPLDASLALPNPGAAGHPICLRALGIVTCFKIF